MAAGPPWRVALREPYQRLSGMPGAVTISTNMAGRGTDIVLGGGDPDLRERVASLGGLYVIGTNRHESRRIDDQLRGRAGRQGDPGSSRFFVSLEDDLISRYGVMGLIPRAHRPAKQDGPVADPVVAREIARAQRIIEGQHAEIRRTLWRYSAVVEEQRAQICARREELLHGVSEPTACAEAAPGHHAALVRAAGAGEVARAENRLTMLVLDRRWSDHLRLIEDIREGDDTGVARPKAPLASESAFRLPSTTAVMLPAADAAPSNWAGPLQATDDSFRWKPAIGSTLLVILTQNPANLTSARFHDELEGPFLKDWFTSAGALFDSNWDDGNKAQTNDIAHPIGGAIYASNARMNDPKYAALLPGDPGYGTGVLRSMAFAAAASLMYEIGPISEASIGNLGMKDPNKRGWVDPVMTPVLGAGRMVLEDVVHQQLLRRVKGRVPYTLLHIFLNPARTISNTFNFRPPCPRDQY